MKITDIRLMSDDELEAQLKKLAKERLNLRFSRAAGQLDDTSAIRKARRDYARLLYVRHERRLKENA